ncbi:hypothetical protein KIN20_020142 [Parelaphostrongylus tenuis]|uniref:Uncharacterized protein n=1 Tax=Parelaphostrongylus tenuis TaxID=148309 RepID=A0AAD5QT13_PARTN|nr:hypothetical protein KIN20_020142 [Parelaphostrongylus tenuis]
MVYFTTSNLQGPVTTATQAGAKSFVMRVIMQAVINVLKQQGRKAELPDPIILIILSPLTVHVNYDPLEYKTVSIFKPAAMSRFQASKIS